MWCHKISFLLISSTFLLLAWHNCIGQDVEEAAIATHNDAAVAQEEPDAAEIEEEAEQYDKNMTDSCASAPRAWMKNLCLQLARWDKNARDAPQVTEKAVLPPAIPGMEMPDLAADIAAVPAIPYQCMDLGCLCQYIGGNGKPGSNGCQLQNGAPLRKAQRKEYRQLSDAERADYHAALKALKKSGEYDRIAVIHKSMDGSGAAHSGPAFLPWHREYLKRFEIALRQVNPAMALPYWDSSLDGHLPNPQDSILFSEMFAGETDQNGNVVKGDFANWPTFDGKPSLQRFPGSLDSSGQPYGELPTEEGVQSYINQNTIEVILGFSSARENCPFFKIKWNALEYFHGGPHMWVGGKSGEMGAIATASNDPLFWMHHNFMDLIYELWRQRYPSNRREKLYPLDNVDCSAPQHFAAAPMHPFQPWQNVDGLNNKYTDNMYEFAPRPNCNQGPNCGSPYLFCDRSHGNSRCASKVKIGGNCAGFTKNEDVCLYGECQNGKCVKKIATPPTTPKPPPITTKAPLQPIETPCYNEHECCGKWAQEGQCEHNAKYMDKYCKASCRKCSFKYNLVDDCNDRHHLCESLASLGMCESNQFWMAENCRKQCNKCQKSRAEVCSGNTQGYAVTVKPPEQPEGVGCNAKTNMCFNENICCQYWAMAGECRTNATWMACNCRVSCGACIPQNYKYGTCTDYHPKCWKWAKNGQCQSNGWMLANCRKSCNTCINMQQLHRMCDHGRRYRRDAPAENATLNVEAAAMEAKEAAGKLVLNATAVEQTVNATLELSVGSAGPSKEVSAGAEVFINKEKELPKNLGMPKDEE